MVGLNVHAVLNPFEEGFEYLIDVALFSVLLFLLAEEGKLFVFSSRWASCRAFSFSSLSSSGYIFSYGPSM